MIYNQSEQLNKNTKLPDFAQALDTKKLLNIMQKIADATGMGIAACDYCGSPTAGHCGYSEYCSHVQKDPERKRSCEASTGMGLIQAATKHKPYIYMCPFGQMEVSIPIIVDNVFMGGFVAGQISCSDVPDTVNRMELIFPQKIDCQKAFKEEHALTKSMTFEEFKSTASMVAVLLSEVIEKNIEIKHVKENKKTGADTEEITRLINDHEMAYMSMRMNRHFIINCLSTICNMAAMEGAVKTNEMAGTLIEFLWGLSTDNEEESWFICDELRAINHYLSLQQGTMEFEVVSDVPDSLQLQTIPSMILYPVVEYCVLCGLKYKPDDRVFSVSVDYEKDYVKIVISDNGLGLPYRELKALYPHIAEEYDYESNNNALRFVEKRLKNLFDDDFEFEMEMNRGTGTVFTLKYPRRYSEGDLKYV